MALGSAPVETKVSAATIAAVAAGLVVWLLQTYVFRGDLPVPVDAAVQVVVPAALAFGAGFLARHTPRPDLAVDAVDVDDAAGAHALDGEGRGGEPERPANLFERRDR